MEDSFEFYRQINGLYACWSVALQKWLISDMSRSEIEDINPDLPSLPAAMKRSTLPSLREYMADRVAAEDRSVHRCLTLSRFPARSLVCEYAPEIDYPVISSGKNDSQRWKGMLSFSLQRKDADRVVEEGTNDSTEILCHSEKMFQYLYASKSIFQKEDEIWIHFNKFLLNLPEENLFGLILLEPDGDKRSEIVYSII